MLAHRWTSTTAMDQMDIDHVKRVEAGAVAGTTRQPPHPKRAPAS
jgi:hypothetical protein